MTTPADAPTTFERIGGDTAVAQLTARFYELMDTVPQFADVALKSANGYTVRLRDVARIELGIGAARLGRWRRSGERIELHKNLIRFADKGRLALVFYTTHRTRRSDGTAVDGLFDGLGEDGALILRLADGAARVIHAGDVFLL